MHANSCCLLLLSDQWIVDRLITFKLSTRLVQAGTTACSCFRVVGCVFSAELHISSLSGRLSLLLLTLST